jgi:hypothetical protein
VLVRREGQIDILVFSDRQGDTRFNPNVGDHIADGLSALMSARVLLEASLIMVIHHRESIMLASRHGKRIMDLCVDSNQSASLNDGDREQAVRDDIAFLRTSQHILKSTEITGLLYDGRSHTLSHVTSTTN